MTMEPSDLFEQFQRLWRAGTNARLNLECHAGQAWMSLHVHLPYPPHQEQQQHHRGRPGPSRLRRRARRAKARENAAEKVTEISTGNSTSKPSSSNTHVAVQATIEENIVEKVLVDAVIQTQPCVSEAAAQVDLCVHHHHHQEHVQDALCPDKHFLPAAEAVQLVPHKNLVQLDGLIDMDQECDGDGDVQVYAHEHHQEQATQPVSLDNLLGMMNYSRKESEDKLRQEREKDLQELQNLLNQHLPGQGFPSSY